MNQDQIKDFFLKLNHDLSGQKRCFDLVKILLDEGSSNLEDAKKLLTETLIQFDLIQKSITDTSQNF